MRPSNGNAQSALQNAILLTVLYSDLFDFPLTDDELRRYLTARCPPDGAFDDALDGLIPDRLVRRDGYLTLPGRERTIDIRRRRTRDHDARWEPAARYARWLRHVPFVRMVAVCGSQAAGNPRADADIDFFIITAPGRLWTVQIVAMALRRIASLLAVPVCPNYFLTTESLEVTPRDLYHAREIAQTVPLWGDEAYRRFRAANRWVDELLPNLAHADDRRERLVDTARPRGAGALEWLLKGHLGTALERCIHAALLRYYELRLWRRGWRREQLRDAYTRDRQEVMRGGYAPVVASAFCRRARRHLPGGSVDDELQRLFPATRRADPADDLFAELFQDRYGSDRCLESRGGADAADRCRRAGRRGADVALRGRPEGRQGADVADRGRPAGRG